ncbi:DUF3761 domain-containing protein [Nocardia pseudobrasiliensis]|uniref:DUF3761 domain-containing protein n=1 Tax=Nocardia pseudobrasiliensis TaxID=45979 RepID=UPI0009ECDF80|nr:DUF3761 domain-containing protein [Nocardia pseudobrasiliensis]
MICQPRADPSCSGRRRRGCRRSLSRLSRSAALVCPGRYENADNACVARPQLSDTAPDGATAQWRDDTYSCSRNRRGTCSGHGGVARGL